MPPVLCGSRIITTLRIPLYRPLCRGTFSVYYIRERRVCAVGFSNRVRQRASQGVKSWVFCRPVHMATSRLGFMDFLAQARQRLNDVRQASSSAASGVLVKLVIGNESCGKCKIPSR